MKRIVYSLSMIAAFSLLFSCTADLEKRIQGLEKRVAELEKHDHGNVQPASLSQVAVEEVNTDGNTPRFSFAQNEYDFGTVNEGDIVNHTFQFTNTGDAPLVISNATASCGCTVPSWPKAPIAPGETGKIEVKFDSSGKPNQQTKNITITANTNPAVTTLKIKGMVTPKNKANGPA